MVQARHVIGRVMGLDEDSLTNVGEAEAVERFKTYLRRMRDRALEEE